MKKYLDVAFLLADRNHKFILTMNVLKAFMTDLPHWLEAAGNMVYHNFSRPLYALEVTLDYYGERAPGALGSCGGFSTALLTRPHTAASPSTKSIEPR